MSDRTPEEIKRDAYHKALNFKNTGLDAEAIYARLEKQGFPPELALEVANNVVMKKLEDKENKSASSFNLYTMLSELLSPLFRGDKR